MTKENWMGFIEKNPKLWCRGAGRWFLTGDPNETELASRCAPYEAAISTTSINVPDFRNISINGDFQVQIFGTPGHNSVYLYGPNDGVRNIAVNVRGDTLFLAQTQREDPKAPKMHKAIVRIGVSRICNLGYMGNGSLEGINLYGPNFNLQANGRGNVYLSGDFNARNIINQGMGRITIFGVNTRCLDVKSFGGGCINLTGNMALRMIIHKGSGDINIIGANGGALKISTTGCGKIGIRGRVNVLEIRACESSSVYICSVITRSLFATAYDKARIGVAGYAETLSLETKGCGNFAGRFLCAPNAFVTASDTSHINIASNYRTFATATDYASVYFYGPTSILTRFTRDRGIIMPFGPTRICPVPPMNLIPQSSKPPPSPICASGVQNLPGEG